MKLEDISFQIDSISARLLQTVQACSNEGTPAAESAKSGLKRHISNLGEKVQELNGIFDSVDTGGGSGRRAGNGAGAEVKK
jgi:hypothetical protein